jgi:myosin heavy subunit
MLGDKIVVNLEAKQATINRDSIAKLMYKNLFDWIVDRVNQSISNDHNKKKGKNLKFIGILDIFGFEIF